MDYKDISRVNGEIQMIDMRGKDYAMVPERVTAFRKLYPEGFITTEIVAMEGPVVLMKAKETSAVGRCLGFIGLGLNGGGICSAEELVNAITAQKQIEDDFKKTKKQIEEGKLSKLAMAKRDAPAEVVQTDKLPW